MKFVVPKISKQFGKHFCVSKIPRLGVILNPSLLAQNPYVSNISLPLVEMSRARRFCFTINNPVVAELDALKDSLGKTAHKWVYQIEVGENGTPHVQGCLEFEHQRSFNVVKDIVGVRAHVEKCKGNWKQNVLYCTKEEGRESGPWANFDWMAFYPEPKPIDPLEGKELYDWQQDLMEMLTEKPDDRKIIWIWCEEGHSGKTSLAKSVCLRTDLALYVGGKAADVKYAVTQMQKKPTIIFWDLCRTSEQFVSYQGLEEVKNGIFFSPKYESGMCLFDVPHVVVFANFPPDRSKLSADRWFVRRLVDRGMVEEG